MTRIENLDGIATHQRRKIESSLRAIRQGGHTLVLLANAAEAAVHTNDHDAASELESVQRQIQALQQEADEIAKQIEWHPGL